jgi:hypothetical protein
MPSRVWSLYGAKRAQPVVTRGKCLGAESPGKQAKSVAPGCHQLPANFHGKEGVDGSSPSEGLKVLQILFRVVCVESRVRRGSRDQPNVSTCRRSSAARFCERCISGPRGSHVGRTPLCARRRRVFSGRARRRVRRSIRRESVAPGASAIRAVVPGRTISATTRASASMTAPMVSETETPWARPWSAVAKTVTRMPSPSEPPS